MGSRRYRSDNVLGMIIMYVVIFAIIIAIPLVKSHFEMKTFNKFTTGPKATYTDALFSELRVEANRVSE